MIRFAWLRFRTQAAVVFGVLAILAVVMTVTGVHLAHAYDAALATCKQRGDCGTALNFSNASDAFPSQDDLSLQNLLNALVLYVPGLIGMFWGAPLLARELETGTFRLAWTQGITRTRWLAAKIGVVGVAGMAASGLLSLMVTWWESPIEKVSMDRFAAFHSSGVVPVGYAAFAFALGVTAGILIRRTLPAMAVTLAIVAAVTIAFPAWVRPHLIAPEHSTSALNIAAITETGSNMSGDGLLVQGTVNIPGAWVYSSQFITPSGRPASTEPATQACGSPNATTNTCDAYIESLHLRQTVTYQPASRYWPLQWYEAGICLAVALALVGFSFWWIRRDRTAGLNIRRVRGADQPTMALQSSP